MSRGGSSDEAPRGARTSPAADRLWPVLLDRLTDDAPQQISEGPDGATMSRSRFRESVLRDLRWLLNTTDAESEIEFTGYEDARQSVLNYGLNVLSGRRASDLDRTDVCRGEDQSRASAFEQRAADGHGTDRAGDIEDRADEIARDRDRTDPAIRLAAKLRDESTARVWLRIEAEPAH